MTSSQLFDHDDQRPITPGWTFVARSFDSVALELSGKNPWLYQWRLTSLAPIVVAHPDWPKQRHTFRIYDIDTDAGTIRFAAGEYSNGAWGFYLESQT